MVEVNLSVVQKFVTHASISIVLIAYERSSSPISRYLIFKNESNQIYAKLGEMRLLRNWKLMFSVNTSEIVLNAQ